MTVSRRKLEPNKVKMVHLRFHFFMLINLNHFGFIHESPGRFFRFLRQGR
jgi:hypothetical protein